MGFLIGMSATSLVAQFFETRSFKNLWGLTAKKTLVDKKTFGYLEWFISLVIGFLVFEIFTKYVKTYLDTNLPRYKQQFFRWMVRNGYHTNLKMTHVQLSRKRFSLFAAVHHGTRNALNRFSKR